MSEVKALLATRTTYAGTRMWTSWAGLWILELILNKYPVGKIIELGTMDGGLSQFLFDQARWRGLGFLTFDIKDQWRAGKVYNCVQGDVLRDEKIINLIRSEISETQTLLYCDNGEKPREVELYGPHLPNGSIIGVHDWPKEISDKHVRILKGGWTPVYHDLCEKLKTMQRFWVRHGGCDKQ